MRQLAAAMLLLMLLTACTGNTQIVKTEYIKQTIPALPDEPAWYPVVFGPGYCLTEQGAKNLLKNRALEKDYAGQLRTILEGLKQ